MEAYLPVAVGAIIVALMLAYIVKLYNLIVKNKNSVTRAWSTVISQERQKSKILEPLEELTREFVGVESDILVQVTSLRASISQIDQSKPNTKSLEVIEDMGAKLLKGLSVSVEAYPELKSSSAYLKLMEEIAEQQEEVGAAIRIFNRNVEIMNNSIEEFPNSLINSAFNKQIRIDSFGDSKSEANFEFKPNL
mgnify:FL=1